MEYMLMISPFEYDDFIYMTKSQVDVYFKWYVGEIDNRLKILSTFLFESGENIDLDFSEESLIPLWNWYESKIIVEKKSEEEIENDRMTYPAWVFETMSADKISLETYKYGMDIAMYFAEIIRRNSNGKIYWGYFTKPKSRVSVNRPVLLGFKADMDLDPRSIVVTCTQRSSRERNKEILYNTYKIWLTFIE